MLVTKRYTEHIVLDERNFQRLSWHHNWDSPAVQAVVFWGGAKNLMKPQGYQKCKIRVDDKSKCCIIFDVYIYIINECIKINREL